MSTVKGGKIIIVQGAQWGSEGKGMVAAALCKLRGVRYMVRTGAVNAGHTVYKNGIPFKMQQLPVGWTTKGVVLVLGAGAFVHPYILAKEINEISQAMGEDIRQRLIVDNRASLHLPEHTDRAGVENRHHAIGATGKGCSVAITDKIRLRGRGYRLFKEWLNEQRFDSDNPMSLLHEIVFDDTARILNDAYDAGADIMLEGTQGTLLDLHLGPYPYTTHKQTIAGQWMVEAGLSPRLNTDVVLVARTYPIRVAGNSGPMPGEITWPMLASRINHKLEMHKMAPRVKRTSLDSFMDACQEVAVKYAGDGMLPVYPGGQPYWDFPGWSTKQREQYRVALSELHAEALKNLSLEVLEDLTRVFELTTVTKKLRRVAEWDWDLFIESCWLNRPSEVVVTFINHLMPEVWGKVALTDAQWEEITPLLYRIGKMANAPVTAVSTGPEDQNLIIERVHFAAQTGMQR